MSLPVGARRARLAKEIQDFKSKSPWGITCIPSNNNIDDLQVSMLGPKGTAYDQGLFKLSVMIPERYPFEPPVVKFTTPVYHPNIDKEGRICMHLLKMPPNGAWAPTITLESLLISIQTLLSNPNPDDPLMLDIANEFRNDQELFHKNARLYTEKYAK